MSRGAIPLRAVGACVFAVAVVTALPPGASGQIPPTPQLPDVIVRPPVREDVEPERPPEVPSPPPADVGPAMPPPASEPADSALPPPAPAAPPSPRPGSAPPSPLGGGAAIASNTVTNSPLEPSTMVPRGDGPFGFAGQALRGTTNPSAAMSVRSRHEIQSRMAADMFAALENESGVLMQRTAAGQTSPYVRGLTGQQVLLLVDGIRMNNGVYRFGPNQYFNTIDPGTVAGIEVLRGEGSVLWGADAIGGVVNVTTRGADVQRGYREGRYGAGSLTQFFNTADASSYTRVEREAWYGLTGVLVGGSFLNVRNLDTGWDEIGRQPGTNYQAYAGDLKIRRLLSDRQLLTLALQHYEQQDVPRSDTFPGYPGDRFNRNTAANARFFDPQQRNLAYLRYEVMDTDIGLDLLSITASYHRQRERQSRGIPTTRFQEIDVHTLGLNLLGVKELGDWGRWSHGVDWYRDQVDSPFGGAATAPILPDDARYHRFGLFGFWDVPLTQRLTLSTGLRYERVEAEGTPVVEGDPIEIDPRYDGWVGQIGLAYQLTDRVELLGSIAEGFRPPNLDELMANNPNVLQVGEDLPSLDLVPERSVQYQIGSRYSGERLRSEAFVYWIDLKDAIVPITAGPNQFQRANQDAYLQGVEWLGRYQLDADFSLFGNFWYTYGRNRETEGPLSRIPPTQGIAGVEWRPGGGTGFLRVDSWLSRRQDRLDPVRDTTDARIPLGGTPGFGLLNLRAGRDFGPAGRTRLTAALENVTDQPYLVHGSGVFGSGITGRFGLQQSF